MTSPRFSGYPTSPGGSFTGQWWVFHNAHGVFAERGVHGRTVCIDPTARMVIARFASRPSARNAAIDPASLPAFEALAEYLTTCRGRRGGARRGS